MPIEHDATSPVGPPRGFRPRALAEIAIRCTDLPAMVRFYEDVIGLERLPRSDDAPIVFFRIADGFAGHTAVLALFRHAAPALPDQTGGPAALQVCAHSSLHHIALSLPFEEQDAVIAWYKKAGPTLPG